MVDLITLNNLTLFESESRECSTPILPDSDLAKNEGIHFRLVIEFFLHNIECQYIVKCYFEILNETSTCGSDSIAAQTDICLNA